MALPFPPHEPRSSGRESAPSNPTEKSEPTHVGCYGSGVQRAKTFGELSPQCRAALSRAYASHEDRTRHACGGVRPAQHCLKNFGATPKTAGETPALPILELFSLTSCNNETNEDELRCLGNFLCPRNAVQTFTSDGRSRALQTDRMNDRARVGYRAGVQMREETDQPCRRPRVTCR